MRTRNLTRPIVPTLAEIDSELARYRLPPERHLRARSLAVAGAASAALGITSAELFAIIAPAFARWVAMQESEARQ